jgi:hypothetical protein
VHLQLSHRNLAYDNVLEHLMPYLVVPFEVHWSLVSQHSCWRLVLPKMHERTLKIQKDKVF